MVHALQYPPVRALAIEYLPAFLAHRYPAVRMNTSEQLLFVVQSGAELNESLEECLLNTAWCVLQCLCRASDTPEDLTGPSAFVAEALATVL